MNGPVAVTLLHVVECLFMCLFGFALCRVKINVKKLLIIISSALVFPLFVKRFIPLALLNILLLLVFTSILFSLTYKKSVLYSLVVMALGQTAYFVVESLYVMLMLIFTNIDAQMLIGDHVYELGVFALALIALIIIYKTNWWIPIPNKSKRGADI